MRYKCNKGAFVVVVVVVWSFTTLRHFSGHFRRGQLTYQHCSWASLLCRMGAYTWVHIVESIYRWIHLVYRWIHLDGTDFLAVHLSSSTDWRRVRQDGTVWTGQTQWIHIDGFDKRGPCKRTLTGHESWKTKQISITKEHVRIYTDTKKKRPLFSYVCLSKQMQLFYSIILLQ